MEESSIRPAQQMQENATLHQADVARLLEQRPDFVEVACPACDDRNHRVRFEKSGFNFVSCLHCETTYITPRPTPAMLAAFYEHSESIRHWNDAVFPATEDTRRREIFRPRAERLVEICRTHGVKTDVLLDVGAGFGTFCEEVAKLGVFERVIALEPASGQADTCRRKGLEVIPKAIEEIEIPHGVSVVTNFELIEHLFDPGEFLRSCATVLPPGGLLVISTPNVKGFDLAMLEAASDNIAGPNHLNYFHIDSLSMLLDRTGFDVVEALTPGKLDAELVRTKILSGEYSVADQPFLKQILIERWDMLGEPFQQFLVQNNLSSHLWMVAKRR